MVPPYACKLWGVKPSERIFASFDYDYLESLISKGLG
jgi:hypothetical protein